MGRDLSQAVEIVHVGAQEGDAHERRRRHAVGQASQLVFLAGWLAVSGHPAQTFTTCLTGVAALALGMQSGAVGALDVKSIFTTAATATLINLSREAADPGVSETQPLQLAAVLVCLVLGATVGGVLLVHARAYAPVVPPLATGVAIAASVAERRALRRPAPVPVRSMAA